MVSVHVPKTAGSSFTLTLHHIFGNRLWLDHGVPADPPSWAVCVHGHATADDRLGQYPDAPLVAWVRDPVERLLSQWRYWVRRPDPANPVCRRLVDEDLGPVELAELLPDAQARMLGDDLSPYEFVGIVERAELSMAAFRDLMDAPGAYLPHVNLTESEPVSDAERREIALRCAPDVDVYRQGVEKLKALLTTDPAATRLGRWSRALPGTSARGYGRAA